MSGLRAPPGSTLWLLSHELRLTARALAGRKGAALSFWILGIAILVVTGAAGVPLSLYLRGRTLPISGALALGLDFGLVAIFTLILSQTLSAAVSAFYERGDLDLLLSSPVPSGRILTVRASAVALTPFMWFALFATPFLLPLTLLVRPGWILDYALLAALALLAGAGGVAMAMGLFRLIGPKRTRTAGQILAALIGAAFFLVSQARNLAPDGGRAAAVWFLSLARSGALQGGAPLTWPAAAVAGDPAPLLAIVAAAVLVFTLTTRGLGRRFAADAALAAGALATRGRRDARPLEARAFRGGVFAALMRKELRLLLRDPVLLSQVLLRTLYILPMTLLLARRAAGAHAGGFMGGVALSAGAGAVAFMAGQVAGSLAWITISAEDAPELLASAPVNGGFARRAKLTATMIPVAALLAIPLGVLAVLAPWVGFCAILGAAAAAAASGLINLWFEKPAPRSAFRSRRGGSVLGAGAELLAGLGFGIATGMAASGLLSALVPLCVSVAGLVLLRIFADPDRRY